MKFAGLKILSLSGRRALALVVALLFVNLLACTQYVPVTGALSQSKPREVRVTLTEQGSISAAPKIGQRARMVQGILQAMTDSSLSLSVRRVSRDGGIEDSYEGEPLSLSARDYERVEEGRTSVSRSLLLAGALIASTFLVAVGAGELSGGDSGGNPPSHGN